MSRLASPVFALVLVMAAPALAQFSGPSVAGQDMDVAQALSARNGTYVTLTGSLVSHLREEYFLFRDDTGEIRIEVQGPVWQGREITPEMTVRIMGERDTNRAGPYVWVKSMQVVE